MTTRFTLIVGPQTKGAYALNAYVRQAAAVLSKTGVNALPVRSATQFLTRMTNSDRPFEERKFDFETALEKQRTVLCAINFFGSPEAAFKGGAFFANPDVVLQKVSEVVEECQVVVSVDSLHQMFLAPSASRLEARVKAAGWERLFDLSWVSLVEAISEAMPQSDILVLTPKGAATRSEDVLGRVFLQGSDVAGDALWLMRSALTDTGQGVLDRTLTAGALDASTRDEIYDTFADRPNIDQVEARLGIEKITATLLDQRLEEDLNAIRNLPKLEVI